MLKFIFVLVLFETNACFGDTSESDWRSRGWYRPRRNYPSHTQSQNAFGITKNGSESQPNLGQSHSSFGSANFNQKPQSQFGSLGRRQNEGTSYQNPQSFQNQNKLNPQSAFGQNYQNGARNSGGSPQNGFSSNSQDRNSFGAFNQNSRADYVQNQNTFGTRNGGGSSQNGFSTNSQNRNSFGAFNQNSRADYAQNQNTFGTRNGGGSSQNGFSTNSENRNSFGAFYQNIQNQNGFGYQAQNSNSFTASQSQNSFGNSYTQNTKNQNTFGANFNQKPESQNSFGSYSQNSESRGTFGSAFAQNQLQYQNNTSNYLNTGSSSSSYSRGQSIFKGPDYLPPYIAPGYLPAKEPSTTTRRPYYTTTTTRRPFFKTTTTTRRTTRFPSPSPAPAMAMRVPPEPEDDPTTPKPSTPSDKGTIPLDDPRVTIRPAYAPAMAMRVPPEPEDDPTTPKPSTPSDKGTIPLDDPRVTRRPAVAPAMAMRVPPEPEDDPEPTPTPTTTTTTTPPPTTTTTTTTTPPPTTTTTTTTTPPPTTTTTTTTTPPPTTTTTTTTTPPPTTTTTTTTTTPPPTTTTTTTTTPPPTTTTTTTTPQPTTTTTTPPPTTTTPPPTTTTPPPTTTPDYNRMLIEETPKTTTTTTVPPTPIDPYSAPTYLPPADPTRTSPPGGGGAANAMPVPPEAECDPLDPSTYPYPLGIDQRSAGINPCTYVPVRTTTKKPFVGPAYLPPVNSRVGRSPKTVRLADVKGARPVWHVGLYTKNTKPYKQICGGSIVRMDVVITAAHCVWDDDTLLEPAKSYAVGANKVYRPWTEPHDKRAQQSDVREIIVPPRFRGGKTSFQDDIAILRLETPFTYARGLRPVCVDFDDDFDDEQLSEGNSGTVAGWGYTDDVGSPTQYLLWLELPYVGIEECIAGADKAFLKYITSDKFCAGENHTGKALCKGDSGGGLVFWHQEGELITPYLRGVASASARADNKECNVDVVGGFTQITAQRRFLLRHVPDIHLNCRYHYFN